MSKRVWSSTVVAMSVVACATLIAQQPTTSASATDRSDKEKVTVTGCLQQATGSSSSSSAPTSAGTSSSSSEFMLTNATMSSGKSSTSTSSTGTTGSATSSTAGTSGSTGTSYMLDGSSSELRPHLNHEIEITGELKAKTSESSTSTSSPTTSSTSSSTMSHQTIKVDSVRMVASSCTAR